MNAQIEAIEAEIRALPQRQQMAFYLADLPDRLNRTSRTIGTHADEIEVIDDPRYHELLDQLWDSLQALQLELNYRSRLADTLTTQHVGDLPATQRSLGAGPRPSGSYHHHGGTFVYVAFDDDNEILYVGITDDLFARMAGHRRASAWWDRMARIDWEEWPDRDAALEKESLLIHRHKPRFNVVGNPDARS